MPKLSKRPHPYYNYISVLTYNNKHFTKWHLAYLIFNILDKRSDQMQLTTTEAKLNTSTLTGYITLLGTYFPIALLDMFSQLLNSFLYHRHKKKINLQYNYHRLLLYRYFIFLYNFYCAIHIKNYYKSNNLRQFQYISTPTNTVGLYQ